MTPEPPPVASEELLKDLNESQRRAVTHPGRALLLVAGAGTGKTRVLTRRLAWWVRQGVPPWAVLAITFTNKAAEVLRTRLDALGLPEGVWAGTFHSFGAWLLRRYGAALGIDPRFTILDREDQQRLVRDLVDEHGLHISRSELRNWIAQISHLKNGALGRMPLDLELGDTARVFESLRSAYDERLRQAQLLDFDDLLLKSVHLLQEDATARAACHERFGHILVDEYQDTNGVQRDLLLALRGERAWITAVGDPDQSIYRWRGAAVRNILLFAEDFPGADVLLLERNYRSTGAILGAAEAVIARNAQRYPKRLFTEREVGSRVRIRRRANAQDEGEAIADLVRGWVRAGRRHDEIAVLYRVNHLSRAIEQSLRLNNLPYAVVAGVEFFQRREVKDVLAYARLLINPRDEAAYMRVVNVPRRGVGATSLKRLAAFAQEREMALLEASVHPEHGVGGRARKGLQEFAGLIESVRRQSLSPVAPVLEAIVRAAGYREMLLEAQDDIERSRVENVDELLAYAREFDEKTPEGDLVSFLERTSLVSDQDAVEEGTGRVSLMSVHAAKGLEFPCVIVAGAEMGLFPHERSVAEPGGEEEERRLFYVALTRAQDELALTHCAQRMRFTGPDWCTPSPYLRDMPPECVEDDSRAGTAAPRAFEAQEHMGDLARDLPDDAGSVRETSAAWSVGERVRHPYFGEGRLESLRGSGSEMRVTVEFDLVGRKQLLMQYARLEKAR